MTLHDDNQVESLAVQSPIAAGSIAAIVPAAGSGQRFGDARNKLLVELAGKPLWLHAVERLANRPEVGRVVMPVSTTDRQVFETEFAAKIESLGIELVDGGRERSDSVQAGLQAIGDDSAIGWVAIHDAARPLVLDCDLEAVFRAAVDTGAAILATPVTGTIKRNLDRGKHCTTVDRRELWIALTPQAFQLDVLRSAYQKHRGRPATDDAQLVERSGHSVCLVQGSATNLKITLPEDLTLATAILASQQPNT